MNALWSIEAVKSKAALNKTKFCMNALSSNEAAKSTAALIKTKLSMIEYYQIISNNIWSQSSFKF